MKWTVEVAYLRLDEHYSLVRGPVFTIYKGGSRFISWVLYVYFSRTGPRYLSRIGLPDGI